MNAASQRAGGLGARLDAMQFNSVPVVSVGTIAGIKAISYSITPALATSTYVHAAITQPTSGTTIVTTAITNPDVPRLLTITGNQGTVTGDVVIVGTDIADAALTDTITSSGTSTVASTKAFKTVTSITIPTRGAASDSIAIGISAKVGYPIAIPQTTRVLVKNFDGSTDAGTTTAGATAALSVYAAAGTFNAVKILELVFLS